MPGKAAESTSHKQAVMANAVKNRRPHQGRGSPDEPDMLATPSLCDDDSPSGRQELSSSRTTREGFDAVLAVRRMLAQDVGSLRLAPRLRWSYRRQKKPGTWHIC